MKPWAFRKSWCRVLKLWRVDRCDQQISLRKYLVHLPGSQKLYRKQSPLPVCPNIDTEQSQRVSMNQYANHHRIYMIGVCCVSIWETAEKRGAPGTRFLGRMDTALENVRVSYAEKRVESIPRPKNAFSSRKLEKKQPKVWRRCHENTGTPYWCLRHRRQEKTAQGLAWLGRGWMPCVGRVESETEMQSFHSLWWKWRQRTKWGLWCKMSISFWHGIWTKWMNDVRVCPDT